MPRDADRYRSIPRIENGARPFRPPAGRTLADAPGTPTGVEARVMRALRVALLCDRPDRAFRLSNLDVSNPVYLELLTADYSHADGLLSDAGLTGRGPWSRDAARTVRSLFDALLAE